MTLFSRIIIVFLLLMPTTSTGEDLLFATLSWPPYVYDQPEDGGYATEVLKAAFSASKYDIKLAFFPWARVVQTAGKNSYAGYFPEYYSKRIEKQFYFSDPFPAGPLVFFKRKHDSISYANLEDLRSYTIGVVRGYINSEAFDTASFLTKFESNNDLQNFRMLFAGRIDLVVADRYVGYYLVKRYLTEKMEELEILDPPLEQKSLYLCVSRNHPDALGILHAFNSGLAEITESGLLDTLYRQSLLTDLK